MGNLTNYQRQVREYDNRHGWNRDDAEDIVLHMSEELGEISRNILRYSGYKKEIFDREKLAGEITDLLYLLFKLANKFDINLESEWNLMWDRYKIKISRK